MTCRPATAPQMLHTENGQDIELDDGLWKTYSKHSDYKLYVADPAAGQLALLSVIEESDTPVITHYRMKVANRQIAEMEVLLARGGMGALEIWWNRSPSLPKACHRTSAAARPMVAITDSYFTGLDEKVWAPMCHPSDASARKMAISSPTIRMRRKARCSGSAARRSSTPASRLSSPMFANAVSWCSTRSEVSATQSCFSTTMAHPKRWVP